MNDKTTKNKIIETMYRFVAEKGYDKASIGQIADAIGIKKASIYYYFKSKEDIFLQMVTELYQDNNFDRRELFKEEISAEAYGEELISMGEKFIDTYFENQNLRKVYAEIDIQTSRIPALKEIAKAADEDLSQFLVRCMEQGIAIGAFPKEFDPKLNAQILYTILVGIDQGILYDLPIDPKGVWKGITVNLLKGKEGCQS